LLLPKLIQAVNDNQSSGRDIAALIGQDPALAGNLLRIANSPLYRLQALPVESLERAVTLVGTDGLRQMIATAMMQPVLNMGGVYGRFPPSSGTTRCCPPRRRSNMRAASSTATSSRRSCSACCTASVR
jgi:hypothetical protein